LDGATLEKESGYHNNGDYRRSNGGAGIGNILCEIFGRLEPATSNKHLTEPKMQLARETRFRRSHTRFVIPNAQEWALTKNGAFHCVEIQRCHVHNARINRAGEKS
jgi:hypothetical protein